ncbi:MAG: hypothetical protein HOW71_31935 [Nonomuraea sp.]|nr:hypothetical protein [Nonomuraea sp.]
MDRLFLRLVRAVLALSGCAAAVVGVAYPVNAMTRVGGGVDILVMPVDRLRVTGEGLPRGASAAMRELWLDVWGATLAEQALSRGEILLGGLCLGVGCFLLRSLLATAWSQAGLGAGAARRLMWLGVLALVFGLTGPVLPYEAAAMALDRTSMTDAFTPWFGLSWVPLTGAAVLFALALALRAGRSGRAAG